MCTVAAGTLTLKILFSLLVWQIFDIVVCGMYVNENWLKENLKLRLQDIFRQEWRCKIVTMPKCSNYAIFKKDLVFEKYLTCLNFNQRVIYSKFRCRNSRVSQELANLGQLPNPVCHVTLRR